ncbi:hypothetical protein I3843_13G084500 [Carya illinoinensis]|nr:hypothetical protein I3843_13G084500 [Carya illinoinensis]
MRGPRQTSSPFFYLVAKRRYNTPKAGARQEEMQFARGGVRFSGTFPSARWLCAPRHSSTNLFVGGLSYDTNEAVLKDAFGQHGEIIEGKQLASHHLMVASPRLNLFQQEMINRMLLKVVLIDFSVLYAVESSACYTKS